MTRWFSGYKRSGDRSVLRNLTQVYGLGAARAAWACRSLGILGTQPWSRLSPQRLERLNHWRELEKASSRVGELARVRQAERVQRKIRVGSLQGIRRRLGLPVHGQNTRTNGSTARRLNGRRAALARS